MVEDAPTWRGIDHPTGPVPPAPSAQALPTDIPFPLHILSCSISTYFNIR